MQTDHNLVWNKCLAHIRGKVNENTFNTWFSPVIPSSCEGGKLTLQVPSRYFYEYLENNHVDVLRDAVYCVIGEDASLSYLIRNTRMETALATSSAPLRTKSQSVSIPFAQNPCPDFPSQLVSKYTLDNFFEGESNRLARSAAIDVVHNPGKTPFNPLFLYGPSGVGKTHLCHAIGNHIVSLTPNKRVLYVSAHLFYRQYTDAVIHNTSNDFLRFYQHIDVLLLDDIHVLIGKGKTQDAFFHIFNHLHQLNKQLVLTSDKRPAKLDGLEDRIITRLKWGLTAELLHPDLDLRKQIIDYKTVENSISLPDEATSFIAEKVIDNVRDIEGIIVSLAAEARLNKRTIDMNLVRRIVSRTVRIKTITPSIPRIRDVVCRYYNIDCTTFQASTRKQEIVQARQVAMYLAKKYTDSSLSTIGDEMGHRNHTSVLYALKTIQDKTEVNKRFRAAIETIEDLIKNG
ncbi:MAG: chromosomal replication initiator protein DnaA [Tannerellaceae bacterium]|jgi:chromosomal replication initiator protein|nr:chromosomal replication initiator protein DnaA [Tannerellaceae bacterium]